MVVNEGQIRTEGGMKYLGKKGPEAVTGGEFKLPTEFEKRKACRDISYAMHLALVACGSSTDQALAEARKILDRVSR